MIRTASLPGYKVDLHVHTTASPDGAISTAHVRSAFDSGKLSCIAITDHDTITGAEIMQKEFGTEKIIIGEEISTTEGEVIGLYLLECIPAGLSAHETVRRISAQGGLVYIPHPFETVRKGIKLEVLQEIASQVNIIEVHNGRAFFQNYGRRAMQWAVDHKVVPAASSDAHGRKGWGRTYTLISEVPKKETLVELLRDAYLHRRSVGAPGLLYPKLNRLRKRNVSHAR